MVLARTSLPPTLPAMANYDPLKSYLAALTGSSCALTFDAIEAIIDAPLPQSATEHPAWWSNDNCSPDSHVQALSWTGAGWRVDTVRLHARQVRFVKEATSG